jgi:integrase
VPSTITLAEVAEQHCAHLETVLNRRAQTVQDYRIMIRKHLVPYFGDTPLADIDPNKVEAFFRQQIDSGLAHSTVANQANLLGAIFAYAVKRGLVAHNPVEAADKPRATHTNSDIRF